MANTHDNEIAVIIDTLGGPARLAKIFETGSSGISEMARRGTIPVKYWPRLIAAAAVRQVVLDADRLMRAHVTLPIKDDSFHEHPAEGHLPTAQENGVARARRE